MRQGAQGQCTGMTLRDGMGREVGGRIRMGNTCTHMADSCHVWQKKKKPKTQYCKVNSLQLEVLVLLILSIFFQTPLVILQKLCREGRVWAEGTVASYPSLYSNDHTSGMPKAVLFHTYYLLY